jgi:hypothetical protein
MPQEVPPVAVELAPSNYLDLAWQSVLDNPVHYATGPSGLIMLVVVSVLAIWRNHVRKKG